MSEKTTQVEKTQPEITESQTQPAEQQQGPDLTVQDLNALKTIIDVASQRGAFKPNEMVTVGQAYNKLEAFLDAVTKQQPAQGA
jgi:translation initiation factor IF-2